MSDSAHSGPRSPGFLPVLNSRFSPFALTLALFSSVGYAWTGIPAVALAFMAMLDIHRHPGRRRGMPSALLAGGLGMFFTCLHFTGMDLLANQWDSVLDLLEMRAILMGEPS